MSLFPSFSPSLITHILKSWAGSATTPIRQQHTTRSVVFISLPLFNDIHNLHRHPIVRCPPALHTKLSGLMSSLVVPQLMRYNHELLFSISGPCINIDSLSTRRQRRTKIMLRIMDNPTVTRKLRKSCKFTSSRVTNSYFYIIE